MNHVEFRTKNEEILRVTADGEFIWHEDADRLLEESDFSFSPGMKHILKALREKHAPYKMQSEEMTLKTNGMLSIDPVTGDVGIGTVSKQEPVAWRWLYNGKPDSHKCFDGKGPDADVILQAASSVMPRTVQYFYTAPPSKPWVSLTDEELDAAMAYWSDDENSAYGGAYCADGEYFDVKSSWRYIEAALKQKNS